MAAATEYRQLVSVFLASPGDLAHEREIAKAVVTRLNKNFSRAFNLTVELVIWEDVPSSYGRPQEIINRDHLARCDLFVGMLNQRWGTPTGDYSSGFAEEFALSEQSLLRTGRPAMSMLFKAADEARIRDPGEDFKNILAFKEEIKERILHHTFDGDTAFKEHLEDILYQHVLALKREQDALAARDKQVAVVHGEDLAEALPGEEDVPQLPRDSVNFLRAFASKASSAHHAAALAREEVARFRLLATLVSSGNDDAELGVHDANALSLA